MKTLSMIQLFVVALAVTTNLQAGEFSEHFIGAKAGIVNYIEGQPQVFLANETRIAAARSQVSGGNLIRTGSADRLEILLNPGSYLRVGFDSELRVLETKFEAMHFDLVRGSVIVESATFNRKVHALRITTGAGDVVFEKAGLYRLEVQPSGIYVAIHEGKAKWMKEEVQVATLKSGKRFLLAAPAPGGEVQFAKLDKKDADELDRWSRRRAEFLVAANDRLSPGLVSSFSNRYGYSQRGGWLFNPYFGCYTFLPYDMTFGSPYGFRYGLFLPVRYRPAPDYGWPGADTAGGYRNSAPTMTSDRRSTVSSAPSAPAAQVDAGQADQGRRSGTLGSIRNR